MWRLPRIPTVETKRIVYGNRSVQSNFGNPEKLGERDVPLDSKLLPTRAREGEKWKRRVPKGETERPTGYDTRLDVWRWPKGHSKGGKFAPKPDHAKREAFGYAPKGKKRPRA